MKAWHHTLSTLINRLGSARSPSHFAFNTLGPAGPAGGSGALKSHGLLAGLLRKEQWPHAAALQLCQLFQQQQLWLHTTPITSQQLDQHGSGKQLQGTPNQHQEKQRKRSKQQEKQQNRSKQQHGSSQSSRQQQHQSPSSTLEQAKQANTAGTSLKPGLQQELERLIAVLPTVQPDAVTPLLRKHALARTPVPHLSMKLLLQHSADNAAACTSDHIWTLLHAATAAGLQLQQQQSLLQPLLQRALQLLLADLDAAPAAAVGRLLYMHELAGHVAVPQQQMQLLLQHMLKVAGSCSAHDITRVMYHARLSGLQLSHPPHKPLLDQAMQQLLQQLPAVQPQTVTSLLHAFENAGRCAPHQQLQQLVDYIVQHVHQCEARDALRLVRSAAFAGLRLQQPVLVALLQVVLASSDPPASALLQVLRSISFMGQQLPQQLMEQLVQQLLQRQPHGGLTAGQAAAVLKAVSCLGQSLPQELLLPLLQPLLHHARTHKQYEYMPALLIALSRMRVQLTQQQMEPLLQLGQRVLSSQAAAYAAAAEQQPSVAASKQQQRQRRAQHNPDQPIPRQQQRGQQQQVLLPAGILAEFVKALGYHRQTLRAAKAGPLTQAFLAQQPGARDIANYVSALGAMGLAVRLEQMTAMQQQLLQQPDQLAQLNSVDVGNLMWGAATMGYSLSAPLVHLLAQQQLALLKPPVAYSITQTVWAAASMGSHGGQQQQGAAGCAAGHAVATPQQQQQELALLPPELMQQLLNVMAGEHAANLQLMQQQQQLDQAGLQGSDAPWGDGSGLDEMAAAAASLEASSGSSNSSERALAAPGSAVRYFWNLSLAAWAAALCDAGPCKETVLQLCNVLAQPPAWQALRLTELVQLVWVHLWLCDYAWSDTGGLAACLRPEQLMQMKTARQQQVLRVAAKRQHEPAATAASAGSSAAAEGGQPKQQVPATEERLPGWWHAFQGRDGSQQQQQQQEQMLPMQRPQHLVSRGPSVSQRVLFKVVSSLPCIASATLEHVTEDGLFGVDIEAVMLDGRRLAIEFDGPFHYAVQVPCSGAADGGGGGGVRSAAANRPAAAAAAAGRPRQAAAGQGNVQGSDLVVTRTTLFRNKALEARGYTVVCVPYYGWQDRSSAEVQRRDVQQLIDAAIASGVGRQG